MFKGFIEILGLVSDLFGKCNFPHIRKCYCII